MHNLCRYTYEINQETLQQHCECQLTSPHSIARLWVGDQGICLSMALRLTEQAAGPHTLALVWRGDMAHWQARGFWH